MTETPSVRWLERADQAAWSALFASYLAFYRAELTDAVVSRTFERLLKGSECFGLLAVSDAGPVGFAHGVMHRSTWSEEPVCYLEDLFVDKDARGDGAARALIAATGEAAAERGASTCYWHTQQFNAPARSLYETMASLTSFVVYERSLR